MSNDRAIPRRLLRRTFPARCDPDLKKASPPGGKAPFTIYVLEELATGRSYVGLTARPLEQRIAAHLSQAGRDKPVRDGGLMAALRRMMAKGGRFEATFTSRIVARAQTADQARALERRWVEMLVTRRPHGYNDMPGGSSVGSVDNVRPLTVTLAAGQQLRYRSIHDAIAACNAGLVAAEQPILQPATVYYRLASGWPPETALGYRPHQIMRQRPAFHLHGTLYTSLKTASTATGVDPATLRSRLHRLPAPTVPGTIPEIGGDRRSHRRPSFPLRIVWPGSREVLTAAAFAARTGVAKSTVIHRWHRAHATIRGQASPPLSPKALFHKLTVGSDRRKPLRLVLPDGTVVTGGERELIRRVLADRELAAARRPRLTESGIRRRIRTLTGEQRVSPAQVGWAFGFITKGDH